MTDPQFSGRETDSANQPDPAEYQLKPLDDNPVLAELVVDPCPPDEHFDTTPAKPVPSKKALFPPVNPVSEFHNMSAIGGSVGAFVLGIWSIICALITPYSAFNAIMAFVLGFYGLQSKWKRLAIMGMALGFVGLVLSLMETNEILSRIWAEEINK